LRQLQDERERLEEELVRKEEELFKLRKGQEQQQGQFRECQQ
jgi:hypothetical protein